jgi:mxaJ protein
MSSRFLSGLALLGCAACCLAQTRTLRVCADPNNLPFSNQREEGFENRLAEILARDLSAKLEYIWWPERKSFMKGSLNAGLCDVVLGVPTALDTVAVTRPYYRSTYVFVSRPPGIASLDDPRLDKMRIGVHLVGEDYAPPANALARRGLSGNLVPFLLFAEQGVENPPGRLVDAVAQGDVDVAIIWGPFGGYFAKREKTPLAVMPVTPSAYLTIPFTFEMSVGVRKADQALRDELDRVIARECGGIQKLLNEYGVPLVKPAEGRETCESSQGSSSVALH